MIVARVPGLELQRRSHVLVLVLGAVLAGEGALDLVVHLEKPGVADVDRGAVVGLELHPDVGCSANVVRAQVLPDRWPGGTLPIVMAHPAPSDPVAPPRFTAERYFALVDEGVLGPDDRVELLEGVIGAMSPGNPPHDAGISLVCQTLIGVVGKRASVRCQLTLVLHRHSAPEPDVAVVPGHARDYATRYPEHALLVVEVADSSLAQDRITKAAMYAAGGVPEYWILNLRDDCLEVLRAPLPEQGSYAERTVRRRGERIELAALPGVIVAVDDLLPGPA